VNQNIEASFKFPQREMRELVGRGNSN